MSKLNSSYSLGGSCLCCFLPTPPLLKPEAELPPAGPKQQNRQRQLVKPIATRSRQPRLRENRPLRLVTHNASETPFIISIWPLNAVRTTNCKMKIYKGNKPKPKCTCTIFQPGTDLLLKNLYNSALPISQSDRTMRKTRLQHTTTVHGPIAKCVFMTRH